jgi:hypothetical protein
MQNELRESQTLMALPARYELAINIGTFNVAAIGDTAIVGVNVTTITAVNVWANIVGVAF